MGDQFKPIIKSYGSLSKKEKQILVPISKPQQVNTVTPIERKNKSTQLSIVELITLSSSPKNKKDNPTTSTTSTNTSVNLDDDVITLSPDLVPFSIPEDSQLTKEKEDKVLAVVTLDESPPCDQIYPSNTTDPLEVVITLPDSPGVITVADSPPNSMDSKSESENNFEELIQQVIRLIEKHEPNETNKTKLIAKVNARVDKVDKNLISEELNTFLKACIEEIEKSASSLYAQLKKILDKLKCPSKAEAEPVAGTSTSIPSTSTLTSIRSTSTATVKKVIKPITLDTASIKHYDKQNYLKALEIFEQLISLIENTEPDRSLCSGIVTKLRNRLEKAEKKYLYSNIFLETLTFSINGVLKDPSKMYGFIRKTSDELKANMKCTNAGDKENSSANPSAENPGDNVDEDEGLDEKTKAHIRKLEIALKKIGKEIKKLENTDCWGSDEDDENSAYIKEDRYKRRYMQIYSKICELRKRRVDLGRPTHSKVKFECTEYPAINRTIEKFYNKTHQFPDYGDVLSLVQKVSDSSGLHLSSALVQHVAEKAFTSFGEILKQRRMEDDYDIFISRLGIEQDPAVEDEELSKKLEENRKHWSKIDEVINKYVVIQEEKKNKGEEEAEESTGEGDEDEDGEGNDNEETDKDNGDNDENDESDSEKENDASDNEDTNDSHSNSESKRRKKEDTSNHHENSSGKSVSTSTANDMVPCYVVLDDCIEAFHNSPDKETSFFKYLKLEKTVSIDEDENSSQEEDKVEHMEVENDPAERKEKVEPGSGLDKPDDVPDQDKDKAKPKVGKKLDMCEMDSPSQVSQPMDEDQNSIVTSTTDPEYRLPNEEHASKELNDTGDSITCVTSSVDMKPETPSNEKDSIDEENKAKLNIQEDKTIPSTNVPIEPGTDSDKPNKQCPHVAKFIDKNTLKLQLDDEENVDEIFDNLEKCQVELEQTDVSSYVEEEVQEPREVSEDDAKSNQEESDFDDEECGVPVKKKKVTNTKSTKTKNPCGNKRKRKETTSEEEEDDDDDDDEAEVSGKSDDSSDEDFNPYEEARALRDLRQISKKPKKRRTTSSVSSRSKGQPTATNMPYNIPPGYGQPLPNAGIRMPSYQPRQPIQYVPLSRVAYQNTKIYSTIPKLSGVTITPTGSASQVPNLKNVTITKSGEMPSSTSHGYRGNIGPASAKFRTQPGPASRQRPMGPASATMRPNVGQRPMEPASATMRSNVGQRPMGPASETMRSNVGQRPMGPASATMRPNVGQRPPMGPASATMRPNVGQTGMGPASSKYPQQPRTISQQNSGKSLIKGGVQFERNSIHATQAGGVNTLRKESNINSRQRLGGALYEQQIKMQHTIQQDQSSGAGQDRKVTSNVQKTVMKDGRQVIRKVKKIVTTNVEVEEIVFDPGEVINLD